MRTLTVNHQGELTLGTTMPTDLDLHHLVRPVLLWVDFDQDDPVEVMEHILARDFGFHPLAVDDALNETHIPKVDDWESYLYLALQDVIYNSEHPVLALPELDLFLGRQFLVTYHLSEVTAVDRVWRECQRNGRWLQHGADHILYRIIDEIVNNYTAVLEDLESAILQMESDIFTDPDADLLEQLTANKRTVLQIRRVLAPQREVVNKLARNPYAVIGAKDQVYFRDVYDHMVRLYDLSDSVRDLLMGSMEIYLTVVNNRMNDIMKTLTVITTLFMPLTFITGFFGMNFFQAVIPSQVWTGPLVMGLTLLGMVLLPLFMIIWFRHHAWM
jgi:magnesium transporter